MAKFIQKRVLFYIPFLLNILFYISPKPAYATTEFDPISSGIRVFIGLLIVLLFILALSYLLRKRFSLFHQNGQSSIKVLEIKQLMPKKTLIIIEIEGKKYLVGAGSDSIDTIVPLGGTNSFDHTLEIEKEKLQS